MELLLFLSSGLFLGWSLGANDAANVFGTAVGTRMVSFRSAAIVCSSFIILGATMSGAGAAHTLGRLGAVNALAGSFTVALAAALATFWMTRLKIPVSTSQSIVGAIIGWNLYSASVTDESSLTRIMITWIACPLITGVIAVVLFILVRWSIHASKPHLLRLDFLTRLGLMVVGAFGSYSLGANNIANVMGVFVPDNPFNDLSLFGMVTVTGTQQLFFLGAVAIAVGVFTYSQRVMGTVGGGLTKLSPISAFVVVLAQSITLFLFASEGLEQILASRGLPTIPLVPVSSSQAVIGAIVGISLFKGAGIRYRMLGNISLGWIATPVVAGAIAFILLFFMDNVFNQDVSHAVRYRLDNEVISELARQGIDDPGLVTLKGQEATNSVGFKRDLEQFTNFDDEQVAIVIEVARTRRLRIDPSVLAENIDTHWLTPTQVAALRSLSGREFEHAWQLHRALAESSAEWRKRARSPINKSWNKELSKKLSYLERLFALPDEEEEAPNGG